MKLGISKKHDGVFYGVLCGNPHTEGLCNNLIAMRAGFGDVPALFAERDQAEALLKHLGEGILVSVTIEKGELL